MITSRGARRGRQGDAALLDPGSGRGAAQRAAVRRGPGSSARRCGSSSRETGVDHVDLNFGCPVPKITKKGGGAALPWKRSLLARGPAVPRSRPRRRRRPGHPQDAQGPRRPPASPTSTRAGSPQDEGVRRDRAARPNCDSGLFRRPPTGTRSRGSRSRVDIPVLGNGDIWEARTRCAWSSRPGATAWSSAAAASGGPGSSPISRPRSPGDSSRRCRPSGRRRHGAPPRELLSRAGPAKSAACASCASSWRGASRASPSGSSLRQRLGLVSTSAELDALLEELDTDQPFPEAELGRPRGRTSPQKRLVLPEGWLDDAVDSPCALDVEGGARGLGWLSAAGGYGSRRAGGPARGERRVRLLKRFVMLLVLAGVAYLAFTAVRVVLVARNDDRDPPTRSSCSAPASATACPRRCSRPGCARPGSCTPSTPRRAS